MAKTFVGNVDVVVNTKKQVTVKASESGRYNATTAAECYAKVVATAKTRNLPIHKSAIFSPELKKGEKPVVVLLAGTFGQPYLALIAERDDKRGGQRVEVIKD